MSATTDDWALRSTLQLCGSVSPPTYADLHTAAHLQTFDMCDGGAALWGESGKLFLVKVLHQSQAKPSKQLLRHVTLDPPLQPHEATEVEQIKLNASGSQALLLAKSWLKVIRLPEKNKPKASSLERQTESISQKFFVKFEDGSEQEITLRASELKDQKNLTELVKQYVSSSKRVTFVSREQSVAIVRSVGYFGNVRHAAWHPLSDTHIVVLSDAEEIEVFNTQQNVCKAEQRHRLDFSAKARAESAFSSCFCFGASMQLQQQQAAQLQVTQLWDAFTCYVLRSDGAVYALCPLVPYECCVSKTFLRLLGTAVDAQIHVCKQRAECAGSGLQSRLIELKSQKYWLQEGWAPATTLMQRSSSRIGGRTQTGFGNATTDVFCYLCPHVSGISPDTWPIALQGPVEVTPQSSVEVKNRTLGGSLATSLLVVPHVSRNVGEKCSVSGSPFLMRMFTSGHVELILLDTSIRPQWQSSRPPVAANAVRKLPALLLECLNLGIDDTGGKAVLERDAADPRLVYCLHSTGVHVINVSWVFALALGKQFTMLPKSSVRHIFSVSPGSSSCLSSNDAAVSNVVGARVVKNVNFGHLLLLRLASGSFEVVNISAASSELLKGVLVDSSSENSNFQKTLLGTLASMASSKLREPLTAASCNSIDGGIRAFGDIVAEKLEDLSARGTRVSGNTLMHEVDDAVVAFVIERVKILYEDVEYIDDMDQLIRDRLQLLAKMIQAQCEKVVAVQKSADEARSAMNKLEKKMECALAVQQNLSKRAAAVLQAVKENQPQLSRAEREFKSELDLMAIELRRMKPRVAELTVKGQRAVRSLETEAPSTSSRRYWNPFGASSASSKLSNEKKKMCYDVLRAETQLIDDTKVLLENLSVNVQQLKE